MLEQPKTKWDNWLRDGLVTPPADFHTKVMARVALIPFAHHPTEFGWRLRSWL